MLEHSVDGERREREGVKRVSVLFRRGVCALSFHRVLTEV